MFQKMRWINGRVWSKWGDPCIDLSCLTAFWLLSVTVVNPVGNFPLNDDWSFGLTVKHLLETGNYQAGGWVGMTLLMNVLWGSTFCLLHGFSFTVLRFSTLVASWLGMVAVYGLMRECRQSRGVTLLAALVFAFDPVYYLLSYTFMTDVLFVALAISAGIFFLRDLTGSSNRNLFLATLFSLAAVMSRQVGLAVPLAFAVVSTWQHGGKARSTLRAAAPLILCVAAMIGFEYWQARTGRLPALYNTKSKSLVLAFGNPVKLAGVLAHSVYLTLMYLGLYLSPLLVLSLPGLGRQDKKLRFVFGCAVAVMAGLTVVNGLCGKGYTMPLSTNIINKSGLGPLTLQDSIQVNTTPMLPGYFWMAVTLICVAGAAILISRGIAIAVELSPKLVPYRLNADQTGAVFLLLTAIINLAPFFATGFVDRYLFPAVPFLMAGLLMPICGPQTQAHGHLNKPAQTRQPDSPVGFVPGKVVAAILLGGFVLFSVCGTRDYLAWNRARWRALNDLIHQDQVQPAAIDGGFEFNGYYLYRPDFKIDPSKGPWWVVDNEFLVNFHPATNYSVYRTYPYYHWMPTYMGRIYVLKRNAIAAGPVDGQR